MFHVKHLLYFDGITPKYVSRETFKPQDIEEKGVKHQKISSVKHFYAFRVDNANK